MPSFLSLTYPFLDDAVVLEDAENNKEPIFELEDTETLISKEFHIVLLKLKNSLFRVVTIGRSLIQEVYEFGDLIGNDRDNYILDYLITLSDKDNKQYLFARNLLKLLEDGGLPLDMSNVNYLMKNILEDTLLNIDDSPDLRKYK